MKTNTLPLSELLMHFYIEDDILKWSHDISRGSWKKKGDSAGSVSNNGYLRVSIKTDKKRFYMVHRIMYQIYNLIDMLDDGVVIDHIDRNPLNNSKSNLRIASKSENNSNCKLRSDNESGYSNITKGSKKQHRNPNKWYVDIQKNGIKNVSSHCTLEDAIKARDSLLVEMHGAFSKINYILS